MGDPFFKGSGAVVPCMVGPAHLQRFGDRSSRIAPRFVDLPFGGLVTSRSYTLPCPPPTLTFPLCLSPIVNIYS